ncbi:amelogenin, X isoform [Eublepharis macularius]|uniref:Amelogenin, X isoform n=1 Tax=Eublepharis macularius TaxID=481883 RepID=A0AA97J1D1_EUBMA|nr:amelogenin, X isoform [Eublepharis macularius]XP_054829300.1 amelogenin, X isoform [Eublepharis macularius]XP_054829301.1 amelogenin, X isoform [Eublepharis macularius]XP_054829302.1 amelogenin, X isoform [Eublepharis macularius]
MMKKMKGWTLFMCLFSAAFSLPLPHAQHPGYINFSYEVMTPLKWYQSLIGHQYPRYSYEPMGGWMHHHTGPAMPPHSSFPGFQQIHAPSHQMHPSQQHLQPPLNTPVQPAGHSPFGHMPGQNTMPQYQPGVAVQHPFPPHAGEHPVHHQQPGNPNQPMQPGNPNQPVYQVHPVPPLPPVIHDAPEPWPGTDKTKQEEVD